MEGYSVLLHTPSIRMTGKGEGEKGQQSVSCTVKNKISALQRSNANDFQHLRPKKKHKTCSDEVPMNSQKCFKKMAREHLRNFGFRCVTDYIVHWLSEDFLENNCLSASCKDFAKFSNNDMYVEHILP